MCVCMFVCVLHVTVRGLTNRICVSDIAGSTFALIVFELFWWSAYSYAGGSDWEREFVCL